MTKEGQSKTGPKPDRVKIDMDRGKAVDKALKKKRPKGGWPSDKEDKKDK